MALMGGEDLNQIIAQPGIETVGQRRRFAAVCARHRHAIGQGAGHRFQRAGAMGGERHQINAKARIHRLKAWREQFRDCAPIPPRPGEGQADGCARAVRAIAGQDKAPRALARLFKLAGQVGKQL